MKRLSKWLAMAVMFSSPAICKAEGASITLRAEVPTICEVRYQLSGDALVTSADLIVFCNSPDGARLSAVVTGGDDQGYRISGAGVQQIATPGTEFDVRDYATAFSGREHLQITQVVGSTAPIVPATIVFQIVPVG